VPVSTLEHAIAGLDGDKPRTFYLGEIPVHPHATGPACRLCALAHGATQPIWCQTHPEQIICLRHRRWIRSATVTAQPCLDNQPDILQARKQHLRLVFCSTVLTWYPASVVTNAPIVAASQQPSPPRVPVNATNSLATVP
jgi:hypothetical protein